ncbi:MAG: hypothetical protein LUF33_03740 [Clostridiales bacterium]|nr:hypothetical protein [Clostridiales bacterium]
MQQSTQIDEYIIFLKASPLFKGMSLFEIEDYLKNTDFLIVTLEKGEAFTDTITKSAYVLDGTLATYENGLDGRKRFVNIFSAEGNALLPVAEDKPYPSVTIEAKSHSVVLIISRNQNYSTMDNYQLKLYNTVLQNTIDIFYEMTKNVLERTMVNSETYARNKIIKFFNQQVELQGSKTVVINLTRVELADHLQMDTSTLMWELKGLKRDGLIDFSEKTFTINFE